jgi:hypothetical protein
MRATRFPWLLAALAGIGVYFLMGRATSAETWMRKTDNWMTAGGRYRWSARRYGKLSAAAIVADLLTHGFTSITIWDGAPPPDWPADDRGPGRIRIELTASAPGWIGDSVEVWTTKRSAMAPAAPPANRTSGNVLALLAQGTVR